MKNLNKREEKPIVIYIIGDRRSGSTLLDSLLSQHPHTLSVGELHHLQEYYYQTGRGERTGWRCHCGELLMECPFWSDIMKDIPISKDYITKLRPDKESKLGLLHTMFLKKDVEAMLNNKEFREKGKKVAENRWEIYKTIQKNTGKKIIIDSSKEPYEAFFLDKYKEGEIFFLLMERDIWEVAYSKMRRKQKPEKTTGGETKLYKEIIGSNRIKKRNRIIAAKINAAKTMRVDYATLVQKPILEVENILRFLKVPVCSMPSKIKVSGHPLHGSPSRKEKRKIERDFRWQAYYQNHPLALNFAKLISNSKFF